MAVVTIGDMKDSNESAEQVAPELSDRHSTISPTLCDMYSG